MDRVQTIRLEIPQNDEIFNFFCEFEHFIKNSEVSLFRSFTSLSPQTCIRQSDVQCPTVSFDTARSDFAYSLRQGNLMFGFNLTGREPIQPYTQKDKIDLGEIVHFIDIHRVSDALKNTTKTLNHWGINFSPNAISESEYQSFRSNLARRSNLYSYPTGEEWPFLLPSNESEFVSGTLDESIARNPKFELVYSDYHTDPLIQFDIETKLTRDEVEALFPKPYGASLIGLENMFRSVFIKTDWKGVLLRVDIRFNSGQPDFGFWIAKNGKRY